MAFTSYAFLAFFLILLALYYLVPKRFQAPLLLLGSFVYYALWNIKCFIFLLFTVGTVWFFSLKIGENHIAAKDYLRQKKEQITQSEKKAYRKKQEKARTLLLFCPLVLNLLILFFLKFDIHSADSLNQAVPHTNGDGFLSFFFRAVFPFSGDFLLPLGISFYTLQAVGYLIDVYRGSYPPQKSLWKFALFVSFFPQLIQGPINRYGDLSRTLYAEHPFSFQQVERGLQRILWGFFKKLVIADRLSPVVNLLTGSSSDAPGGYAFHGTYAFLGMIFYTIQLYADFTGGIDIAIGVSECFGIKVKENFLRPYFSASLSEYWRRWHISMCSWFRDYVFYPVSTARLVQKTSKWLRKHLSENTGKRLPVWLAGLSAWLCTGLWHGVRTNYIIWGLLNYAILMISEELTPLYQKFHRRFSFSSTKIYHVFQIARTFLLVCVMNLFDCFDSVKETLGYVFSVFQFTKNPSPAENFFETIGLSAPDCMILIFSLAVVLITSLLQRKESVRAQIGMLSSPVRFLLWTALFFSVIIFGVYGMGYEASQFIYNRF